MEKPAQDPELRRKIEELIAYKGGGFNEQNVADIIENALKLLTDVRHSGDVRVIQTALRELRYAFKLFAPYSQVRKVTIFGSARTQPSRLEYQQALEFGRKITAAGFMVITGAGAGIMQAGHEGAGPEKSFGANIRLPWEQAANPVIREDKKLVEVASLSWPILKPGPAAPIPWALSSTIRNLCRSAIFLIAVMSAHCPYRCTGMMALVFAVMAASIFSGSMHLLAGAQSTKTAVAPAIQIASAVAKKVFG